jgi:hypothetical protein
VRPSRLYILNTCCVGIFWTPYLHLRQPAYKSCTSSMTQDSSTGNKVEDAATMPPSLVNQHEFILVVEFHYPIFVVFYAYEDRDVVRARST